MPWRECNFLQTDLLPANTAPPCSGLVAMPYIETLFKFSREPECETWYTSAKRDHFTLVYHASQSAPRIRLFSRLTARRRCGEAAFFFQSSSQIENKLKRQRKKLLMIQSRGSKNRDSSLQIFTAVTFAQIDYLPNFSLARTTRHLTNFIK